MMRSGKARQVQAPVAVMLHVGTGERSMQDAPTRAEPFRKLRRELFANMVISHVAAFRTRILACV